MKKGVIFDLDGVLLSTDDMHYEAWKSIADEQGICFDRVINNRLRGVSRMASLDIILERADRAYTQAEKESLAERKNERYRALLQTLTPDSIAPEVRQTLDRLKAGGIKLAIGSSSKNTKLILQLTDLAKCFDAVSDGTNITRSKPDPEVFLKAADLLGLSSEDCAVVEDAYAGIDAAEAGGFMSAGIGDAAGCCTGLQKPNPVPYRIGLQRLILFKCLLSLDKCSFSGVCFSFAETSAELFAQNCFCAAVLPYRVLTARSERYYHDLSQTIGCST